MTTKTAFALAAGLIAAASFTLAHAAPSVQGATTLELSAQPGDKHNKNKGKGNQQNDAQQQNKMKQQNNVGSQGNNNNNNKKSGNWNSKQSKPQSVQGNQQNFGGSKHDNQQKLGSGKQNNQHKFGSSAKNTKIIVVKPKTTVVIGKRMRGLPGGGGKFFVHGANYSTWRGANYRIRYHNAWRTFVPLSALAVLAVGARHYYPYAYISAPRLYCEGYTEDGCLLDWREVETLEGDILAQCVAYCPWQEY